MQRLQWPLVPVMLWACVTSGVAQSTLHHDSLTSAALQRTVHFRVYRPADTTRTYPLLLLLHGFGGNHRDWSELTALSHDLDGLPLVVVMPDGDTSWYVNSPVDTGARYEDYLVHDMLPAAAARYGGDTVALGVAGLSMGGYGALVLGLRHPEIFRFIGALSGSLDIPFGILALETYGRGGLRRTLERSFGTDSSRWGAYDPSRLVGTMDSSTVPYIYLANGIQDEFHGRMAFYRRFVKLLWERHLPYEYHETQGRHNWSYWSREIAPLVRRFVDLMHHQ